MDKGLISVVACSTVNVTPSGARTIDGTIFGVGAREHVLLTGQDDAKENGVWRTDDGPWTRIPLNAPRVQIEVLNGVSAGRWAIVTEQPIAWGTDAVAVERL